MRFSKPRSTWQEAFLLPNGRRTTIHFVQNAKAKRLILRLDPKSREPRLTLPQNADITNARNFIKQNAAWLSAQLDRPAQALFVGALLPWDGKTLMITTKNHGPIEISGNALCVPQSRDLVQAISRFITSEARMDMAPRVARLVTTLRSVDAGDWSVEKIRITDTRSRWGSCSSRRVISLSKRLMMAPERIREYVCAHEVAHLAHPNHSEEFWSLCQKLTPAISPKTARNYLKRHGPDFFAVALV